jgi:hypothetical protein
MELGRYVIASVLGVLLGMAGGYVLWGADRASLAEELEKTRGWLAEEMKVADARVEECARARSRASGPEVEQIRSALAKAEAEVARLRVVAKEAADDWRTELERRRALAARLAAAQRECQAASSRRR